MAAEPSQGMSLVDLLHKCVPSAHACCKALDVKHPGSQRDVPGSGLCRLRLVCKGMVSIISLLTRSYTLRLTGKGTLMIAQMTLLKNTQLLELRVNCRANSKTGMVGSGNHVTQMQCFIAPMHHAIHQIQKLYVYCVRGVTGAVELLAPVCAASLIDLHLEGEVQWGLLAAFGVHCVRLTSLTVTEGLVWSNPKMLGQLLPALTHLKVVKVALHFDKPLPVPPPPMQGFEDAGPCCAVMISCANLMSVSIREFLLYTPTWQLLPPALQELECTLAEPLLSDAQILPRLQSIILHTRSPRHQFDLSSTARVVQQSPGLGRLELVAPLGEQYLSDSHTYLSTRCRPSILPLVLLLNARLATGLIHIVNGYNILLRCWDGEVDGVHTAGLQGEEDAEVPASKFLQLSHAPISCDRLLLENPDYELPGDSSLPVVHAIFPLLSALGMLTNHPLEDKELTKLAGCVQLHHLSLATRSHVVLPAYTDKQLSTICFGIPSLEVLQVQLQLRLQPPYDMDGDLASLQQDLHSWRRTVDLKTYTDTRVG